MKQRMKTYFSFSKKEYNGVFILCLFIAAIILFPTIYQLFQKDTVYDFKSFEQEIAEFKASVKEDNAPERSNIDSRSLHPVYFEFDPNGLPEVQWQKLGLSDRQIRMIKNYEAKGGRFYRKEDLQKMYALKADQYTLLEPYITIKASKNNRPTAAYTSEQHTRSKDNFTSVNINEADSITLETIRGIGPAFASRIIKYRNRLGGFYNIEQLREVYGIDSIKYEQIKYQVNTHGAIQKININTAAFDDLKKHPYLSYKQINTIIQYRKQHGNYNDINDLKKTVAINSETLLKISPYIGF